MEQLRYPSVVIGARNIAQRVLATWRLLALSLYYSPILHRTLIVCAGKAMHKSEDHESSMLNMDWHHNPCIELRIHGLEASDLREPTNRLC